MWVRPWRLGPLQDPSADELHALKKMQTLTETHLELLLSQQGARPGGTQTLGNIRSSFARRVSSTLWLAVCRRMATPTSTPRCWTSSGTAVPSVGVRCLMGQNGARCAEQHYKQFCKFNKKRSLQILSGCLPPCGSEPYSLKRKLVAKGRISPLIGHTAVLIGLQLWGQILKYT